MEIEIMKVLGFTLPSVNSRTFLLHFLERSEADSRAWNISKMVLESTLLNTELLEHTPSKLAAASLAIALRTVGRTTWTPKLQAVAKYTEEDILPVCQAILKYKASIPDDVDGLRKKWSSSTFGNVADVELAEF